MALGAFRHVETFSASASRGTDLSVPTLEDNLFSGAVDGPVLRHARPINSDTDQMLVEVEGTLAEIDGCLVLVTGTSGEWVFPMLWPQGTSWDSAARSVRMSGQNILPLGSEIIGNGGFLSLDSVQGMAGDLARTEAERRLQPSTAPQVLVFNNSDTAVALADN